MLIKSLNQLFLQLHGRRVLTHARRRALAEHRRIACGGISSAELAHGLAFGSPLPQEESHPTSKLLMGIVGGSVWARVVTREVTVLVIVGGLLVDRW